MGRDSSVGKAICYGLDGRESNSGEGEIFHTRPDRSINWEPGLLPEGKTAEAWG